MTDIAFVGAGSMGRPMIDRLLAAGTGVRAYARRTEVRAELANAGATVAEDIADAVKGVDLCMLCLFSADQVLDVALGEQGVLANLRPGSVLVVHTTVSPAALDRLAGPAAERRISLVDAPISGTAQSIREGRLTVLLGGDEAAVDKCETVIGAYAGTVLRVGDVGAATKIKLINNVIFAAHAQIAESAIRLGDQLGVAGADLVEALGACSGNSYVFGILRERGVDALGKATRYLRKDVAAAEEAAAGSGIELGPLRAVVEAGPLPLKG